MPSVDIYNLGQKPVKSPVAINDSEACVSYIQGETTLRSGSETHRLEPSLKSSTNRSEIGCLAGKSPRSLERWNNEVREFQKAKRESLRNSIPDYHQWKQRLRLDLEAELSRRTQEAVRTPPRERLRQMRTEYEARESQRALVGQLQREEIIFIPHNLNGSKQKDLVVQRRNILDPKLHPVTRKQQKRHQWEIKAHHARELVTVIKPISREMGKAISDELVQLEPPDKEPTDSTESESDTLRSDESQAIKLEKLPQTFGQVDRLSNAPSDPSISEITKRTRAVLQRRRFSIGTCSHWLTGETPKTNRDSLGYPRSVGSILSCLCDTDYDGLSWHILPNRQATGDLFCFEWDTSTAPDVYRLSEGFGTLFSDSDKDVMTEIERYATTKRTSFNWTTRQAVLQRLQQLTREEKQLFYFSATRTAYLVATTTSHTTLPDGTQLKLRGFDQNWVNNQGPQNHLLSTDSGTDFYSADGSPTIANESNHLEEDDLDSRKGRQVPVLSDWTGVTRDIHGPFWPTGLGPLYPAPIHLRPNAEKKDESENVSANYSLLRISQATAKLQVTGDPEECLISSWFVPQVVYDSETSARWTSSMLEAMGMSSQLGNPRQFISWVPPSLVFESRFECGNLRQARRIGLFEYELLLNPDLNTNRHVQWFYFAIRNAIPGYQYRFVIINFSKKESLYKKGMQVLFYSEKQAERNGRGWHRTGQNIKYTENTENRSNPLIQSNSKIYQLQWDQTFPHADDLCYLAYCYPYSYTDLKTDLKELVRQAKANALPEGTVCCEIMCQTRAGNSCFLVTITDPGVPEWEKIAVILTARVHPGETNSSWVMLGLMRSLISNNSEAELLRRSYVFRIVPMLNPDGVILGNYRCSITGHDLNRNYRKPQKDVFPTIWHTRELVRQSKLKHMDVIYYDFHGHSRRNNVFTYGCDQSLRNAPDDQESAKDTDVVNPVVRLQGRVLPFLLSKLLPDKFSLTACRFNIERQKESTSRVVFWREFELTHSFTLETTFNGSNLMRRELKQFDITDFMEVGQSIGSCLLDFHRLYTKPSLMRAMIARIARTFLVHLLQEGQSSDTQTGDLDASNQSEENANAMHTRRTQLEQGFENSDDGNTQPTFSDGLTTSDMIGMEIQSGPQLPTKMSLEDMVDSIRRLEADREINTMGAAHEPDESSSSDSNSDSEPELEVGAQNELLLNVDDTKGFEILKTQCKLTAEPVPKRTNGGKKVKGKAGRSGRNQGTGLGKRSLTLPCLRGSRRCNTESSGEISDLSRENSEAESVRKNSLTQKRKGELKKLEAGSNFVGKYDGKTNNGIPCFVEKRLLERACQKLYRVWQKTDFTNFEDVRRYWRCIDYVESTLKMALLFETTEKDGEDYRQFLERLSMIKTKTQERLEALSVDKRVSSQTFLSQMPVWQSSVANNYESDRMRLSCSGYSNLSNNTSYNSGADAHSMH